LANRAATPFSIGFSLPGTVQEQIKGKIAMRVNRAIELAKEWVRECGSQLPGFVGAHLGGSIIQFPKEAILTDHTDIDIFCVMEDEQQFRQNKFIYRGAFLETVPVSLEKYRSPEQVLSSPYFAHNLVAESILADPQGILTKLHQRVKDEFPQRRWVQARSANVRSLAEHWLEQMEEATSVNDGFTRLLLLILNLSGLAVVAQCGIPTVRKCLVRAKEAFQAAGQPALAVSLLRVLGSSEMSRDHVQLCLDRSITALDRALEVYETPFLLDHNVRPCARPYLIEGAEQMVQAGNHQEAMFWIAAIHWSANTALQNDAPATERSRWQTGFDQLQHDLMLDDLAAYRARVALARTVAHDLFAWADQVVESR
jgi:hypothetical protein